MALGLGWCTSRWTDIFHLFFDFFGREKTHHGHVFIDILTGCLVFIENVILSFPFEFQLSGSFLLNLLIVVLIILLFESCELLLGQWIQEKVYVNALLV